MDISKWPLDKIMALPDWCFGMQWWVGNYVGTTGGVMTYFLIEESVPNRFVLWDVMFCIPMQTAGVRADATLRLCNEAPTDISVKTMPYLVRGFSERVLYYEFKLPQKQTTHIGPMRIGVESQGKHVGGGLKLVSETANCESSVSLLISGIPREVPDWVVLGLAGRR